MVAINTEIRKHLKDRHNQDNKLFTQCAIIHTIDLLLIQNKVKRIWIVSGADSHQEKVRTCHQNI